MKKQRLIFALIITLSLFALFTAAIFGAEANSGYMIDAEGAQTNLKWTLSTDGVLEIVIDSTASGKPTTDIPNKDPLTGTSASWDKCHPTFKDVTHIKIGDGITSAAGFSALKKLITVEIPTSLKELKGASLESNGKLESIYVRGTEPVVGTFDLTPIEIFGGYCIDCAFGAKKIIFNPALKTDLPSEFINGAKITELTIPEGVPSLAAKSLKGLGNLEILTVLGKNTEFVGNEVFGDASEFPAIKAKSGSKAAEFAKANGYTFIDLDTGAITKGTKPTKGGDKERFDSTGATIWGHSSGSYNGQVIVDTYWAYYDETKTLTFISEFEGYVETGSIKHVDEEYTDWKAYKEQIEHVVIGNNIAKISSDAFAGFTALKDVKLGNKLRQIDVNAFQNCSSLTTIWQNTGERIEGRADFSKLNAINDVLSGTAISELVLPENTSSIGVDLPTSIKTIYSQNITNDLINYAKTNLFNLQSLKDPNEKYEYWIYVDPTLPACGGRAVFDFDEATGTLTVIGAGKIDDIVNYYGGGSKNQPWFDIRSKIKHVIIGDNITSIGKYTFCECENLTTVQIPDSDSFEILNAAFEKCYNLKSVYRKGTDPIEGTLDLSKIHTLNSYTFSKCYLIGNVVLSSSLEKIGDSVFDDNVGLNLKNVYSTPGSFAESWANEKQLTFFDISTTAPAPITCTAPESTDTETEAEVTDTETEAEVTDSESVADTDIEGSETVADTESEIIPDESTNEPVATDTETNAPSVDTSADDSNGGSAITFIIIGAVVLIIAAAVTVFIVKKKK